LKGADRVLHRTATAPEHQCEADMKASFFAPQPSQAATVQQLMPVLDPSQLKKIEVLMNWD
jgi:hypothetical protein